MTYLRVYNDHGQPMHAYVTQATMLDNYTLGFASFVGSRKSLEDVRHAICNIQVNKGINLWRWNDKRNERGNKFVKLSAQYNHLKIFTRRISGSPYWQMTAINQPVYNSCQDFIRGITLSESMRKQMINGSMTRCPLYFLVHASLLFATESELQTYLDALPDEKEQILFHNEPFIDLLYRKIMLISPVPILQEWMPTLLDTNLENWSSRFIETQKVGLTYTFYDVPFEDRLLVISCEFRPTAMSYVISRCIRAGKISTGSSEEQAFESAVRGARNLTQYLHAFNDDLVRRANQRFTPLYVPGIDIPNKKANHLFNYTKYYGNLNYFMAQQDTICSIARGLQKNKRTLVVGECGCGKTSVALGAIYTHSRKSNPVSIIMCPGHMVEEWKKEIKRLYPFARAYIIDSLSKLMPFEHMIRTKSNKDPLFLIMGKDSCKMDYEKRPYYLWNSREHEYMAPNKLPVTIKSLYSGMSRLDRMAGMILFFLKPGSKNTYVRPLSADINGKMKTVGYETVDWYGVKYKKIRINAWTAAAEDNAEWVKIAKIGWVNKKLAKDFVDRVDNHVKNNDASALSPEIMKAYDIATTALQEDTAKALIRCNVSEYIRRRFKHLIDYFIADEVHLYSSSSSAQGRAFSNLVNTAKHTIALTGTLLNGYAEDIFSMLFKLYSRTFIRNGFSYGDTNEFAKEFGVVDEIVEYRDDPSTQRPIKIKQSTKFKPGISPLLFSKFLLDKAVFITLSDITADLPNYHEIPTPIEIDEDIKSNYDKFVADSRTAILEHANTTEKYIFKIVQRMNTYPDQPYLQVPIFNNETGEQIVCPANTIRKGKSFYTNKDRKLLELVKKHKKNGEKVLIYVYWINKLDCVTRIQKLLESEGIKSAFLTASVSARDRERWIHDKMKDGTDVLICNPSLVETGLNLLEFTTIIFYQMGYNLFTMRQASRRSLRLNQSHDVTVYFMYFQNSIQESIISLMANKLQAAMAVEGKFTEEGLNAMGNTDSILTQLANNLTKDIDMKLETGAFDFHTIKAQASGNRFKEADRDFMKTWLYPVAKTRKKPVIVDLDEDLALLGAGA